MRLCFYTKVGRGWFEIFGILKKKTKVTKRFRKYRQAFVLFVIFVIFCSKYGSLGLLVYGREYPAHFAAIFQPRYNEGATIVPTQITPPEEPPRI